MTPPAPVTAKELVDRHKTLGGRFFRGTRNGSLVADSLIPSASKRYTLFLTRGPVRSRHRFRLWRFDTESAAIHYLGARTHESTAHLALDALSQLY